MEEHNLNSTLGVTVIFNLYCHRTPVQGGIWEISYGWRKKYIKYLYLIFVRAEEVSDIPAFTEYERALIQPFCGVGLDLFKDNIIQRSEWVDFTHEKEEMRGFERFDRMRIVTSVSGSHLTTMAT